MGPVRYLSLSLSHELGLALALGIALVACKPEIGKACTVSTDCSQVGDRLCDVSQPDGYCTIFNCEPTASNAATKCPDEAACIGFDSNPSPVMGCENDLGSTPYGRSFCMKKCDNGHDCRAGYRCVDLANDPRFQAVDLDGPTKVCTVADDATVPVESNGGETASGVSIGVCTGTSETIDAGSETPEGNAGSTSSSDSAGASSSASAGAEGN
jgi:hypothetical protein